jgi:hypothetical protein
MDLDDFIITVLCLVDEAIPATLNGQRLRKRGPQPTLADSEVLSGGLIPGPGPGQRVVCLLSATRRALFPSAAHAAPRLVRAPGRQSVVAQRAVMAALRSARASRRAVRLGRQLPVACLFARAYRCRRFRGEAAYGKDHLTRQTFYGFRVHVRLCWPGVMTRICLAPANVSELSAVPDLAAHTSGWLVGDRNYWKPALADELRSQGVALLASFA